MSAQALPFNGYQSYDRVFGFTPHDMTCACGGALIAVEDDLDLDRFARAHTGTRYECANEECPKP